VSTIPVSIDDLVKREFELLRRFQAVVAQYEAKKARLKKKHRRREHPTLGSMLENALIDYLGDALPDGVLVGEGSPVLDSLKTHGGQTDVVMDFDRADTWSRTVSKRLHLGDEPTYLALAEVRYRGHARRTRGVKLAVAEAMEVVRRLQEVTARSLRLRRKCYTAAVCIGPGFDVFNPDGTALMPDAVADLVAALRAFYRRRRLRKRDVVGASGGTWPFVDMLVLPGMLLKKHTLFTSDGVEHPMYMIQPTLGSHAQRNVRPLSTAKGYLRHGVRAATTGTGFEVAAWTSEEDPIYADPPAWPNNATKDEELLAFRTYSRAIVLDGTTGPLYHKGFLDDGTVKWFEVGPSPVVPGTVDAVGDAMIDWPGPGPSP
jgi:hypothetical protein